MWGGLCPAFMIPSNYAVEIFAGALEYLATSEESFPKRAAQLYLLTFPRLQDDDFNRDLQDHFDALKMWMEQGAGDIYARVNRRTDQELKQKLKLFVRLAVRAVREQQLSPSPIGIEDVSTSAEPTQRAFGKLQMLLRGRL
jgi:tRNA A37 N6-isopentenylltransferase MiaA